MKRAVIVIDIQNDYCSDEGLIKLNRAEDLTPIQEMVPRLKYFLSFCRQSNLPLIFFRMDKNISKVKTNLKNKLLNLDFPYNQSLCVNGTKGFEYYKLKPKESDFEFIKYSYDIFTNEKFKKFVKENNIDNLVITGVNSQVCVDASVKGAFSNGYSVIILKDLIATTKKGKKSEKACLKLWKSFYGEVMTSKKFKKII